ncbi:MAG: hypothetical protein AAGC44_11260 [Planctomycetota bacterium]
MQFLRSYWDQIAAQVGDWSFTTKWLIGALLTIMLLVGGIFVWLAGSPEMVPLEVSDGSAGEIVALLEAQDIKAEVRGGQVFVPVGAQFDAIGSLAASGKINANAYDAFDKLVENSSSSYLSTNRENERQFMIAKGKVLSQIIAGMPRVQTATVIIDKPDSPGFGASYHPPSAMVTVFMQPGSQVDNKMADALFSLVSGAVAELPEENVKVIDGSNNREFSALSEDEVGSATALETIVAQERIHKQKVEEVLRSFRGLTVAIKIVTSDVVREEQQQTTWAQPSIARSRTLDTSNTNRLRGGNPGAQANLAAAIPGGGGGGSEETMSETEEEFDGPLAEMVATRRMQGNTIRRINASISVPRSYFVSVFMAQNPESEAPSDGDLQQIIDEESAKILELVQPQLVSSQEKMEAGDISVKMVYDQAYLEPATAGAGAGLGSVVDSKYTLPAMVAGLCLVAFGLMFTMVRKAVKPEELPSIEELAGVPPSLPTDDDLMGEVDELDGGLAGVELDEEELRTRQIADQISELVKANPEEAGGLLKKWVTAESH